MPQAELEVGGVHWVVRVLGRSSAGVGAGAPLLLLGFEEAEAKGRNARETLVVGTALGALSPERLAEALAGSRPARPGHVPGAKPFFDSQGGRRRR